MVRKVNYIYIIYSPNSFVKANDNQTVSDGQLELPRELSLKDFRKWLAKNRMRDKDMQVDIRSITIVP